MDSGLHYDKPPLPITFCDTFTIARGGAEVLRVKVAGYNAESVGQCHLSSGA